MKSGKEYWELITEKIITQDELQKILITKKND